MTCEELESGYTAWSLGVAGEPERGEIAEHLERACVNCVPGIRSAMATVTAMSGAVKMVEPPRALRRRVIAMVQKKPGWTWAALAPWSVAAALSVGLLLVGIAGQKQVGDTEKLRRALAILNDPATRDVTFGPGEKAARGRVFVSPEKGVVFIGASLPKLEAGKVFELWLIPVTGKPVPSGLFESLEDATAVFVRPGPALGIAAVAVTVEPEGGSPQPTTTPFIVAKPG